MIEDAPILLLIGRDVPDAFRIKGQILGPRDAPIAHKTLLGWTIIGKVCMDGAHIPDIISLNKTYIMPDGRPSLVEPCPNKIKVTEVDLVDPIFQTSREDERPGLSIEDRTFLEIMDRGFHKDEHGNWVAPLPFRKDRPRLTNNKRYVFGRMTSLVKGLEKNPEKKQHMLEFMQKVFDRNFAEYAPSVPPETEQWYLPLFAVYSEKKPGQARVVFDSSSKYENISLNDVLLKGPDLTNNLLGVLLRFRLEAVAVTADVDQMFHNFRVNPEHRNFLKFFWFKDNNPELGLAEYRMCVHVFGNTPSPAVATYGLRKSVENADPDVMEFVCRNFYVDDGLMSFSDVETAKTVLRKTQEALKEGGNLRLHKFASNKKATLTDFPEDDLAKGLKFIDLDAGMAPLQTSLGMVWDINSDAFSYKMSNWKRPFTRRAILSTVHSLYDPIG
ncbi:MAG: hypothetical protein AAFP02_16065, partial [Bacteroidota bacterium]